MKRSILTALLICGLILTGCSGFSGEEDTKEDSPVVIDEVNSDQKDELDTTTADEQRENTPEEASVGDNTDSEEPKGIKYGSYDLEVYEEYMKGDVIVTIKKIVFDHQGTSILLNLKNDSDEEVKLFNMMSFVLIDLDTGTMYDSDIHRYLSENLAEGGGRDFAKAGTNRDIELFFSSVPEGIKRLSFEGELFQMGYFGDRALKIELEF